MADSNTDANAASSSQTPSNQAGEPPVTKLIIRSWPKIILMLPTLFVALLCGIIMAMHGGEMPQEFSGIHYVGLAFLLVLGINLTMLLYDLNLKGFIVVALLVVALILGLFLLDSQSGGVWEALGNALSVQVFANAAFYFTLSLLLLFNLAIAWVITRFNYWAVEHNEIIIHKGFMQEQERHPTAQARFKLIIEDIVEYGILGSGTLVFTFGDDDTKHELTTVLFCRQKAKKLDQLLGRVMVTTA